jgi:hypothetical protein
MKLWLEDIFDIRNYIGEKKLNERVIDNIKREVDLMFFVLESYLEFLDDIIDEDEFFNRYNNIKSNSMLGKDYEVYNIDNMKKIIRNNNEKEFIDNVLNLDNLLVEFGNEFYNRKDKDLLNEYYKKKLNEFLKKM